jgi:TonB family protein
MASPAGRSGFLKTVTVLAVAFCSATAFGITQGCTNGPSTQVLQLDRRTATHLLLSEIRPSYPPLARINYIRGHVRLLVTVNCQGKVQQIHVVRGHPFLAVAALQAIHRWVYRPFLTKSGPTAFQTTIDVDFSLLSRNIEHLPPQPEKFLEHRVQPPQILSKPTPKPARTVVRMRVLVNDKGRVVDSTLLSGTPAEFETAKRTVKLWKFKPAKWGNINVPWYSDVEVPLAESETLR